MEKCYLVKEQTIWGAWTPVMVCASQEDAFIAAEALGLTETTKPKGQVVDMAYKSGDLEMAVCYLIEKRDPTANKWVTVVVTMGQLHAISLAASYGVDKNKEPRGRVVALPLL